MSYTAVLLDEASRVGLINAFQHKFKDGWEVIAHHMTVNLGSPASGPALEYLGKDVDLVVTSFAQDNLVMAVGVRCEVPSTNAIKHITLAVNRSKGGKPYLSNKLTHWDVLNLPDVPILSGRVVELQ